LFLLDRKEKGQFGSYHLQFLCGMLIYFLVFVSLLVGEGFGAINLQFVHFISS
jgi:hypothetical protein